MFNNFPPPPPENRAGYEKMWKHATARQATADNITRRYELCMLDS
jgi:hypothetical protein